MESDRIADFLKRTENRSAEDVCCALVSISESLAEINKTLSTMKLAPYVHVTAKTPDIKLPDIYRKETIHVKMPTGFVFLAMSAPYVIIIGIALVVKFYPLLSKAVYGY